MADDSKSGGGGLKYGIIGLLLIGAAVGIYFWATSGNGEQVAVNDPPDAGFTRSTKLAEPEIVIPEPEDDAGMPDAAGGTHTTKIVYVRDYGDWGCSGDIPAGAASRVVGRYQRQIRSCYERRLKSNHTLQGRAVVRVRVGANGSVTAVQTGGNLGDPEVFTCMRNIAQGWQFPAPQGGRCAVVSVPFSFTPRP